MAELPEAAYSDDAISDGDRVLLAYLWRHAGSTSSWVFPSRERIASTLRISESTMRRRLRVLQRRGWALPERREVGGRTIDGWELVACPPGASRPRSDLTGEPVNIDRFSDDDPPTSGGPDRSDLTAPPVNIDRSTGQICTVNRSDLTGKPVNIDRSTGQICTEKRSDLTAPSLQEPTKEPKPPPYPPHPGRSAAPSSPLVVESERGSRVRGARDPAGREAARVLAFAVELDALRGRLELELGVSHGPGQHAGLPRPSVRGDAVAGLLAALDSDGAATVLAVVGHAWRAHAADAEAVPAVWIRRVFVGDGYGARRDAWATAERRSAAERRRADERREAERRRSIELAEAEASRHAIAERSAEVTAALARGEGELAKLGGAT